MSLFPSDNAFTLMTLCITVIMCREFRADFMTDEAQLSDSGKSSSKKPEKFPPHD
jgi:hypothetical protein